VPTADVLPTGVRRRLSGRDALLPAVLCAELLAGVLAGAAWESRAEVLQALAPPARPAPVTVVEPVATTMVVVPPPPAPPTPPPPPLRTVPRNPFAVQVP